MVAETEFWLEVSSLSLGVGVCPSVSGLLLVSGVSNLIHPCIPVGLEYVHRDGSNCSVMLGAVIFGEEVS